MQQRICFTGGGTAGHVMPNLPLIDAMKARGVACYYIGSHHGLEKDIIQSHGIPYQGIASGKFRRYLSWRHLVDPFLIFWGIVQSFIYLGKIKAKVVFSKGGFVAFPVVVAAFLRRIPVISHESDLTPGLANRICLPFVHTMCISFKEGLPYYPAKYNVVVTGNPLRASLFQGDSAKGLAICGFSGDKPTILVMGGGLGAVHVNEVVRSALDELLAHYHVIHLCGKDKVDEAFSGRVGYKQFEFVTDELPHLLALSDMVISRAGANAIFELLALKKPHILVPIGLEASRGDQIKNAQTMAAQAMSLMILNEAFNPGILLEYLMKLREDSKDMIQRMGELAANEANDRIIAIIQAQLTEGNRT